MSKEIKKKSNNNFEVLQNLNLQSDLQDVKSSFNIKTGIASFTGAKDGYQYTTIVKREQYGITQTMHKFEKNLSLNELVQQVKDLTAQGYKQRETAELLGISQASVSKYSRM